MMTGAGRTDEGSPVRRAGRGEALRPAQVNN
ncbi:MAG: hypothetical protein K0R53_2009, partial [Burkholderiales bacterium]|nr:hypothetical protein [Burkholderiales bacterium]